DAHKYNPSDITVLIDETNPKHENPKHEKPTRANILNETETQNRTQDHETDLMDISTLCFSFARESPPFILESPSASRWRAGYDQRTRSRLDSMANLAGPSGATSASDLLSRDSVDGSTVRMRFVVREDGKPPTHFQLGNCIGRGQFGSVYRALNLNTGQVVAVKRIRLGLKEEEVTTPMREINLVKGLSHPSIVKYEGMARDDDTLSIVLENTPLPPNDGSLQEALSFIQGLEGDHRTSPMKALDDLYHEILKGANILITENGTDDFGNLSPDLPSKIGKDVANMTRPFSLNWMAPEGIELKGMSANSDIYSFGSILFEVRIGRRPYEAESSTSTSGMLSFFQVHGY
ncbi:kinase-like domain-containing protein, partial [Flammula alnicola]